MRHLLSVVIATAVLSACSWNKSPEEEAAKAALAYYHSLLEDSPEDFLQGRVGADSLPDQYRAQLLQTYRHFMAEMEEKHGGIREVSISANVGRRDSTLNLTYAFLMLEFGDSTQEEITVPMVEVDGEWKMK